MPGPLRVALLGGGKMAQQHAAAIRQCPDARLVAVVDPNVSAEDLKQAFGADVATIADTQAMLAGIRPDVVHVVTPPGSHAALARQCLEAGACVYVEKPFALTTADAESILSLAESRGLKACAAHQVLFQESGRRYRKHLPMIGKIIHVESFFSFRPVRRRTGGGPSTPVDQLIDILPHPVYLLLDALPDDPETRAEVTALDVSIEGEVRAVIRKGDTLATLVVSLRARPVESWLRVMGANGMVEADFVLGNVIRHPGPGASAISVVLKPFSRAWQTGFGSLKSLLRLIFRRHKSYPGLAELLSEFYRSVQGDGPPPVAASQILETVRICEGISERLQDDTRAARERAAGELRGREARLPPTNGRGIVLLTGGTGFLGRVAGARLRGLGWRVRVPARQLPAMQDRVAGVEYCVADLASSDLTEALADVAVVVHLAAETAGTHADHERNTIAGTRRLLAAMEKRGIRRLINVSSVAVLKPARFGASLDERSPVDHDNPARGPYVWAKAAAERLAQQAADAGVVALRTIRLGPLVDYDAYAPPGRLGRELARLFVAIGRPGNRLSVCDVATACETIADFIGDFDSAPPILNLMDVPPATRGALVARLRAARPDLRFVWLPLWILRILSATYFAVAKLIRPRARPLDLYAAFASVHYDLTLAESLQQARHARRGQGSVRG